ncbi:DNA-processing protein DprA [Pedobacter sp. MC2016-24]|uniref:DNA-processing protein DprA n=1 Tax=Pedobacter sp. MC2016-24 TaxID=2780090 RepID=UPI00187FDEC8|nr:DNA-processing protein DprA [Pedobacter sp. MC2016-24]MBE9601739.1 DNA-protecting protein DprA [Pedobacter sp. MC2016-24]
MSLLHQIGLTFIGSVGHVTARHLLEHFGSAEAVFKANLKQLREIPGVGPIIAGQIKNTDALVQAAKQLHFIEKHQVQVLFYTDSSYPYRLRNCADAPVLLYYKGTADLNHPRVISVVGSRKATAYGRMLCAELAENLAAYDVLIVSGLAYGIDVAAHKESLLQQIPTVGVLAHGLDRIYPAVHQPVAHKMVLHGGLLTEFPLNTIPDKENFPKRNRIIAGIADATIVVEATEKGGALITAELANSYNRDVYAFPGRTTDACSQGCNFLIKTNRAGLINHARDLVYQLGWEPVKPRQQLQQLQLPVNLSTDEGKIVEILKDSAMAIDKLAIQSGIQQSKLTMHLLNLEMRGILTSLPGKTYQLI